MEEIKKILHEEKCSCVIKNKTEIRKFFRRGVIDIYELYRSEPVFLKDAIVADKIVGKGAAAIFSKGGINKIFTDVISEKALALFNENNVVVEYNVLVPNIINRNNTGICPLENLCGNESDSDKLILIVDQFMENVVYQKIK